MSQQDFSGGMNDEIFRQAVLEHAKFLGMDDPDGKDAEFLYIAEEALTSPLPENWEQGVSEDGVPYHYNSVTGESIWEHPRDQEFRELYQKKKKEKREETRRDIKTPDPSMLKKEPVAKKEKPQTSDNDKWMSDIVAEFDSDEADTSASFESSYVLPTAKPKQRRTTPIAKKNKEETGYVPSGMTSPRKRSSRPNSAASRTSFPRPRTSEDALSKLANEVEDLNTERQRKKSESFPATTDPLEQSRKNFSKGNVDASRYDNISSSKKQDSSGKSSLSETVRGLKHDLEIEKIKAIDAIDECTQLRDELALMKSAADQRRKEMDELRSSLKKAEQSASGVADHRTLRSEIKKLKAAHSEDQQRAIEHMDEISKADSVRKKLESEKAALQQTAEKARAERSESLAKVRELTLSLSSSRQEIEELKKSLKNAKKDLDALHIEIDSEKKRNGDKEQEILSTSALRNQELSEKNENLERQLNILEAKSMEVSHANEKLKSSTSEWKEKAMLYEEARKSSEAIKIAFEEKLHHAAKEKQEILANQESYNADLKERVAQLEAKNRNMSIELRVSSKESEARIMELEGTNSRLKTEIIEMEERSFRVESKSRQESHKAAANSKELADLRQQIQKYKGLLDTDTACRRVEQLESEKKVMSIELSDASETIDSLRKDLQEAAQGHSAALETLTSSMRKAHDDVLMEAINETAKRAADEWRSRTAPQVQAAITRADSLEEQLELEREEHEEIKAQLQAKNELLETRIKALQNEAAATLLKAPAAKAHIPSRAAVPPPMAPNVADVLNSSAHSGSFSLDFHALNVSLSDLRTQFRKVSKTVNKLESKRSYEEDDFQNEMSRRRPTDGISGTTSSILHRLGLDGPDSFLSRSSRSIILDDIDDPIERGLALPDSPAPKTPTKIFGRSFLAGENDNDPAIE